MTMHLGLTDVAAGFDDGGRGVGGVLRRHAGSVHMGAAMNPGTAFRIVDDGPRVAACWTRARHHVAGEPDASNQRGRVGAKGEQSADTRAASRSGLSTEACGDQIFSICRIQNVITWVTLGSAGRRAVNDLGGRT
jgi:hypothetical protein